MFYNLSRTQVATPSIHFGAFHDEDQVSEILFGNFRLSTDDSDFSVGYFNHPRVIKSKVDMFNFTETESIESLDAVFLLQQQAIILTRKDGVMIFDTQTKETWFVYEFGGPQIYLYLEEGRLEASETPQEGYYAVNGKTWGYPSVFKGSTWCGTSRWFGGVSYTHYYYDSEGNKYMWVETSTGIYFEVHTPLKVLYFQVNPAYS